MGLVQSLAEEHQGWVDVPICQSGVDTDCIAKYGFVTKNMIMINDAEAFAKLGKRVVRSIFEEALKTV